MDTEKIVDLLVKEAQDQGVRLTTYLVLGERVLTMGVTLLALLGTLVVINGQSYVLIGGPFALCVLVTYVLHLNTEAVSLGGYKSALETEVNRRVGSPVQFWESQIAHRRHVDISTFAFRLSLSFLFISSSVVAIHQALRTNEVGQWGHSYSSWIITSTILSILVGSLLVAISFHNELASHRRTQRLSEEIFETNAFAQESRHPHYLDEVLDGPETTA
ncbi:hypothetical protein JF66_21720 [Cryobacterium sp. MLB-32]|uniref:hypothetical protein n=1 Tax=Cryobacterium sp. MLB-32 TaxID=1529318 RepID=UPI0004E6EA2C|nr:hypothetical protein [Cryobacterium sp. MLB-32]KFF58025.1 hypothetical protein JF66_21720 [Cryobacterium sp. MLB-32]